MAVYFWFRPINSGRHFIPLSKGVTHGTIHAQFHHNDGSNKGGLSTFFNKRAATSALRPGLGFLSNSALGLQKSNLWLGQREHQAVPRFTTRTFSL